MKNFDSLPVDEQSRLLTNIKRTQLVGLIPTAVIIGSVFPLAFIDLKSLSQGTLVGALAAFGVLFMISMLVVVVALVKQRKLLNSLAKTCGCSRKTLLKEARKAVKSR